MDIKSIKSKVECWGQENSNIKKYKKSDDIIGNLDLSSEVKYPNDFLSELYNTYYNIENHFSSFLNNNIFRS